MRLFTLFLLPLVLSFARVVHPLLPSEMSINAILFTFSELLFFLLAPDYFNSAGLFFMSFACWPLIYSLAFLFLTSFFSIPIIFYFSLPLFFELAWTGAN